MTLRLGGWALTALGIVEISTWKITASKREAHMNLYKKDEAELGNGGALRIES
jgi:hypothetical protein